MSTPYSQSQRFDLTSLNVGEIKQLVNIAADELDDRRVADDGTTTVEELTGQRSNALGIGYQSDKVPTPDELLEMEVWSGEEDADSGNTPTDAVVARLAAYIRRRRDNLQEPTEDLIIGFLADIDHGLRRKLGIADG